MNRTSGELDKIEKPPIIRGDVDTVYSENIANRLLMLECFVSQMVERDREFMHWEEKDKNDKPVTRILTFGDVFDYCFVNPREVKDIFTDLGERIKTAYLARAKTAVIDEENRKKEAERVARLKEKLEEEDKRLAELKKLAEKKAREDYEWRKKDEARIRKIQEEEREAYDAAVKEAEEAGEDVYVAGVLKKLDKTG